MDSESEYSEDFEGSSREVSGRQSMRERTIRKVSAHTVSDSETESSEYEDSEDSEVVQKSSPVPAKRYQASQDSSTKTKKIESSLVSAVPTVAVHRTRVATKRDSNPTKPSILTTSRKKVAVASKTTASKGSTYGTSPRDREMSACNNQVRKLASKVTYLGKQLEEFKKENRLLKRIQVRQEKELDSVHGSQGELPKMIHRHNEEVRYYKERLKHMKEVNDLLTRKLHSSDQSVSALLEKNNKLKRLTEEKNLLERDRLTQKLQTAQEKLKKASDREQNLVHTNEMLLKKHETEYRFMEKKKKLLVDQMEELTLANQAISRKLKEREKESEVLNIYTQKIGRPFPKIQPTVHVSKETQTEVSLSSSKEMFSIPPSLSNSDTQTVAKEMTSTYAQTDELTSIKNEAISISHDVRSGSGVGMRQSTPQKTCLHKPTQESPQRLIQADQSQLELKEESKKLASDNRTKFNPVPPPSGPPPKDVSKVGQVTAANGTAQLKDEAEMKKKLLLSKLFTMGSDTSDNQPQKDIPAKATNNISNNHSTGISSVIDSPVLTTVPASIPSTLPTSTPSTVSVTRASRQPGTSMSVSSVAATTVASNLALSSKPWTNLPHASTAVSTAIDVPFSNMKMFQSMAVSSVPFSSGPTFQSTANNISFTPKSVRPEIQSSNPTFVTQSAQITNPTFSSSYQISVPKTQPSALNSTTYNPTGSFTSKGNAFAFGSTYTHAPKPQSQFSSGLPVQTHFTSLTSAVELGDASQQNTSRISVQQNTTSKYTSKKIDEDKKKDLLAKLTAIDSHDDTSQTNKGKFDSKGGSSQSSTTQLWPNTVENLHQGKHAYATEMDPYGSKVYPTDARKDTSFEKINSGPGSGRHTKVESKSNLSTVDGNDLKRNASGYSWETKVDVQAGKKGGIFADIMGQTTGTFNTKLGQSGTRVFGTGNTGVNSLRTSQIRTTSNSYYN